MTGRLTVVTAALVVMIMAATGGTVAAAVLVHPLLTLLVVPLGAGIGVAWVFLLEWAIYG